MKKVIYILMVALTIGLASCGGSGDNTSVQEIVDVINSATQTEKTIAEEEASGARQFGEIHDDEVFTTPNGNIFANETILSSIKANPNYKLTSQDKEMLLTAVEAYFANDPVGLSIAKDAIEGAKTLNDLYKIGLAKEVI